MTSSKDYYQETLYPFQDMVLMIVERCSVPFYLTGGTALSRAYLKMRYSDDLDFFQNSSQTFLKDVGTVVSALEDSGVVVDRTTMQVYEGYVLMYVSPKDGSCRLKLDFVNDVEAYFGETKSLPFFKSVDSMENITANKLSAIVGRSEAKDVVDLWSIWRNYGIPWKEAFSNAAEKEASMDVAYVADVVLALDEGKYSAVKFIEQIPFDVFHGECLAMCREMVSAAY